MDLSCLIEVIYIRITPHNIFKLLQKCNMEPFIYVSIVYGLMTLVSASILFFSFREKVDTSGKYLLPAKSWIILVIIQVIVINIDINTIHPRVLFFGNLIRMASEIAVFLSIYTLTRKIFISKYVICLLVAAVFYRLVELAGTWDLKLPIPLIGLSFIVIAIAAYIACKSLANRELNGIINMNMLLRRLQKTQKSNSNYLLNNQLYRGLTHD